MAEHLVQYTDRVRRALGYAQQLATEQRHTLIRPEHVLVGLLQDPEAQAAQMLRALGVDPLGLRQQVAQTLSPGLGSGASLMNAEARQLALAEGTRAVLREA